MKTLFKFDGIPMIFNIIHRGFDALTGEIARQSSSIDQRRTVNIRTGKNRRINIPRTVYCKWQFFSKEFTEFFGFTVINNTAQRRKIVTDSRQNDFLRPQSCKTNEYIFYFFTVISFIIFVTKQKCRFRHPAEKALTDIEQPV